MSFEVRTVVCLYKRKYCHNCPFRDDNYCHIFVEYLSFGDEAALGYRRCRKCIEAEKLHKEKKAWNSYIGLNGIELSGRTKGR